MDVKEVIKELDKLNSNRERKEYLKKLLTESRPPEETYFVAQCLLSGDFIDRYYFFSYLLEKIKTLKYVKIYIHICIIKNNFLYLYNKMRDKPTH